MSRAQQDFERQAQKWLEAEAEVTVWQRVRALPGRLWYYALHRRSWIKHFGHTPRVWQ